MIQEMALSSAEPPASNIYCWMSKQGCDGIQMVARDKYLGYNT